MTHDVFISYRRKEGKGLAESLYRELKWRGYRVFRDIHDLDMLANDFPPHLLKKIANAKDFVVILTEGALERCSEPSDWLRQEIAQALRCGCKILPLLVEGFDFSSTTLPDDIASLTPKHGMTWHDDQADAVFDQLCRALDSKPRWWRRLYYACCRNFGYAYCRNIGVAAILCAVLLAIVLGLPLLRFLSVRAPSPSSPCRYGFESGMQGWRAQVFDDSQGCTGVAQSGARAKQGQYSLEMQMDLVGGDVHRSQGEVWVDLNNSPPDGVMVPVDLTGKTITAWVYVPEGATGDGLIRNGLQLFVKDSEWRNLYGRWKNITAEGEWLKVTMLVNLDPSNYAYKDDDFDPARIAAIGLTMGVGEGSRAAFKGTIYLDAVDW